MRKVGRSQELCEAPQGMPGEAGGCSGGGRTGGSSRGWGGRGKDQGEGGRMPSVPKDAVLLQHGEAPEELQGVGPGRWAELLTGSSGQNGMEMDNICIFKSIYFWILNIFDF